MLGIFEVDEELLVSGKVWVVKDYFIEAGTYLLEDESGDLLEIREMELISRMNEEL